ncbi:MAG TPA: alpha/beta fold hydrolase [Ktedonobacteraceae bacterium]|nr:alpha/beta fold hydrolase [Ktedonobacteraceae bacterium]
MKKRSVRRLIGQCVGISASATLATLGVVALRHALNTPQPLKSSLPGEALLYGWRRRSVFYKVLGNADAPPLVLLHAPGIGASAQTMQRLMTPLAESYRVYAPDLPGFGLSDRPGIQYSGSMYTEFCQDFLRDVVQAPATLVATELSCNYAIEAAAHTPELCASLIMISPPAWQEEWQPGPFQAWAERPVVKALLYPLLSTRPAFLFMRRGRQNSQTDFEQFYAVTHQLGAEHASMAFLAGKLRENVAQQFSKLRQPMLLIWSTQMLEDQHNLAMLRSPTQNHQAREVELIASSGPAIQEEQPDRVIAAIRRWQKEAVHISPVLPEEHGSDIPAIPQSGITTETLSQPATSTSIETPGSVLEDTGKEAPALIEPEASPTSSEELEKKPAPASIQAYCVKCRKKTEIKNASEFTMKNGRLAVRGVCSVCGSGITRIGGLG